MNLNHIKLRLFLTGLAFGILLFVVGFPLFPIKKYPQQIQAVTGVGTITIDQSVAGTFTAQKITDSANAIYFLDPAATDNSLVTAGDATVSGNIALGNTKTLRSAFGPLQLQYKSGLNAWTTGLTLQDTTGNVGIGTADPTQKIDVVGTVKATAFSGDGSALTGISGVPAGLVSFFNLAACPTGWTELTAARGMYMVGLPAAGTLAGTSGTALTNLESRPVGQHLHSVDPASTSVTITDPGHVHSASYQGSSSMCTSCGDGSTRGTGNTSSKTTGITASVNIAAFDSANAGSVAGTNAPYIQLLACQKD